MDQPRLLSTRDIVDVITDAATTKTLDEYAHGGHPEDIASMMSLVVEGAAATLVALRRRDVVRWDQ